MNEGVLSFFDSNNHLMALLIKKDFSKDGIDFLTPEDSYFQIATMKHHDGHVIASHYHNKIERVINYTSEVLIIKEGSLKVFLFENEKKVHDFLANKGDVLVLFSGGHGFLCVGDVSMIEIKQGPFVGAKDKTRF